MRKNIVLLVSSFLIFSVLCTRYVVRWTAFQTGTRLLLPVWIEKIETKADTSIIDIRYHNFIPVEELEREKGTVVVKRMEDGRIDFIAKAEGQERYSKELMLKYTIIPPSLFDSKQKEPSIYFASSRLHIPSEKKFSASAIRYAVVYVDSTGDALLAGLADSTGTMLVSDQALSAFHIR